MGYSDVREQSAGDLYPYVIVARETGKGLVWYWQLGEEQGVKYKTQQEAERDVEYNRLLRAL